MRKRIHIIPIILILVLSLFMAGKQLVADFYYSMARKDGRDPNRAIRYLNNCILIDGKNPSFHFTLGREFLRKGLAKAVKRNEQSRWLRESLYEFRKAIDLRPSSSDYHFHLGINYGAFYYHPAFYWRKIQDSFVRTAFLNPTDVRHLYTIGMYYLNEYGRLRNRGWNFGGMWSKDYEHYLLMTKENYQSYFRKLLEVNEDYLGEILQKCFSVTDKYFDLKAVIRETPSDHTFLAKFLHNKGMWEEAKREFLAAINLEPTNPVHYSAFAYCFYNKGDYENAIYWWQRQKLLNDRDEKIYLTLADVFIKLRRFDDALKELRDSIDLDPENINYRIKLIETLIAAQRINEAIDEYRKLMGEHQDFSKLMYDKMRYYQKTRNYAEAVSILNKAVSSFRNK
jgi:tetratricopeptide (TPR) repeat protein